MKWRSAKIIIGIATVLFILSGSSVFAESKIVINVGDEEVYYDDSTGRPYINKDNKMLVPLRATFVSLGALIDWDESAKVCTINIRDVELKIDEASRYLRRGDSLVDMGTISEIRDGRMYVPFRTLSEEMGFKVNWKSGETSVTYPEYYHEDMRGLLEIKFDDLSAVEMNKRKLQGKWGLYRVANIRDFDETADFRHSEGISYFHKDRFTNYSEYSMEGGYITVGSSTHREGEEIAIIDSDFNSTYYLDGVLVFKSEIYDITSNSWKKREIYKYDDSAADASVYKTNYKLLNEDTLIIKSHREDFSAEEYDSGTLSSDTIAVYKRVN